jgi:hypothetical protein
MVWIALPATLPTGVTQDRTAWPSTRTVQAPQAATPQPNLVPVICRRSRSTHSKGMAGSACTCTRPPFSFSSTEPLLDQEVPL